MLKEHAIEAAPIVNRMLLSLLVWTPTRGRAGSDVRTSIGDTIAHSRELCQKNEIGPPLVKCFDLARVCGITLPQLTAVRNTVVAEKPVTLGATIVKHASIGICLATECSVLAQTEFVSRDEVETTKRTFNDIFNIVEEVAADEMDQMSYQAAIGLHAAIMFYLIETARPLPRMLSYHFAYPIPSLAAAYKLYDDAGRADELKRENHTVHPAFLPMRGRALSA